MWGNWNAEGTSGARLENHSERRGRKVPGTNEIWVRWGSRGDTRRNPMGVEQGTTERKGNRMVDGLDGVKGGWESGHMAKSLGHPLP